MTWEFPLPREISARFQTNPRLRKINRCCVAIKKCREVGQFSLPLEKSAHVQTNTTLRKMNLFCVPIKQMPHGGAVLTFPRQICACSDKTNTPLDESAPIFDRKNAEWRGGVSTFPWKIRVFSHKSVGSLVLECL